MTAYHIDLTTISLPSTSKTSPEEPLEFRQTAEFSFRTEPTSSRAHSVRPRVEGAVVGEPNLSPDATLTPDAALTPNPLAGMHFAASTGAITMHFKLQC